MKRRTALKNTALMMGGILSASAVTSIFESCKAPEAGEIWQPTFLNVNQGKIVSKIADILVPRTDTPGAVDALVPQFVDLVIKKLYKTEDQQKMLAGFQTFEDACKNAHGKTFLKCSDDVQLAYLKEAEKAFIESEEPNFFGTLKGLIYRGYFSSEPGATEVLRYEAIPGNYEGCVPFSEIGSTWAT